MKAIKVVAYHKNLELSEAPQPNADGPLDVIVKVGAAGVCRTDIHILEGRKLPAAQTIHINLLTDLSTQDNGRPRLE